MNDLTAVVIGASGLIGSQLTTQLLNDPAYKTLRALVRRPLEITHPKLEQVITNFNDINDYKEKFGEGDVIFCCIGTTRKKVKGNKDAYRSVDFDIPVNAAEIGIAKNFSKYMLVSSVGANEASSNFYIKLKGQTEMAVRKFNFKSIGIFQPSILLGNRAEVRPGEKAAQKLMKVFSGLFFGSYKKYRAIDASEVAKAMNEAAKKDLPGIHYFTYTEMMDII